MSEEKKTGAENARWDLSCFYAGLDDPQIDADIAQVSEMQKAFCGAYKGNLKTTLGAAIRDFSGICMLLEKIMGYLSLVESLNLGNESVKTKVAETRKTLSAAEAENLTFLQIEIAAMDDDVLAGLINSDELVKTHEPWLKQQRREKPHLLSEEVESALTKRSPVGPSSWSSFYSEMQADLRFNYRGENKTLTEILNILSHDHDSENRALALRLLNEGLSDSRYAKMAAQTLNMVMTAQSIEDRERDYAHPMASRNLSNQVPDEVVEALHKAVAEIGSPLCRRYYRLKAVLLGKEKLLWSDRNAPLPIETETLIPWDEAVKIVCGAYQSFSPTLAGLVRRMINSKWVDAPPEASKKSGAFNQSLILPGNRPVSFNLLNFMGTMNDVGTLAHELGHGVHGLLAAEAQGILMYDAPIAYCETASTFGEMVTFNYLKEKLIAGGKRSDLLALLVGKLDDEMNTIVRQIGFSNFERLCHGAKRRLSVGEYNQNWITSVLGLYGADGEVFDYEKFRHMDHLALYIPHFRRPFYVYGYAFGELFVYCLMAKYRELGDKFEPLYLQILRAGGTKDANELLKPFGVSASDPTFWTDGLKTLDGMIAEAEALARELGYNVP